MFISVKPLAKAKTLTLLLKVRATFFISFYLVQRVKRKKREMVLNLNVRPNFSRTNVLIRR